MKTTIDESQIKVLIDLAKQATAKKCIEIIDKHLSIHHAKQEIKEKFGLEI